MDGAGRIAILNGAPRSGKSSIARAIQTQSPDLWLNFGVDAFMPTQPPELMPGIGLRPGGERPDLEPVLPRLFSAFYAAIAAQARTGCNIVVDIGHHDAYSRPLAILPACARQLAGLEVSFVGVFCPLETILARRAQSAPGHYLVADGDGVPGPVLGWQQAVHAGKEYDLTLDTGLMRPEACATAILAHLAGPRPGPSAFERLAGALR